jgi:CheY-like chemotaxis protein
LPQQQALAPEIRAPEGRRTVLLAEDEEGVRHLAEGALRSLGCRVTTVADGREAVQAFASDPDGFDLVVLDAVMPHLSGVKAYETMSRIRGDLPVLYVSGYSAEVIEAADFAQGARLLQKPFTTTELKRTVCEMLGAA